jgi:hypothetical protein
MSMPYSDHRFNADIYALVKGHKHDRVLDIGAGAGKWGHLLQTLVPHIDAVEVYRPYIQHFKLWETYMNVFCCTADDCTVDGYDLCIMGDVLEHMTVFDAQLFLSRLQDARVSIIVMVPFEYEQGICYGNEHERHLQPDLTHELFMERYPGFTPVKVTDGFGLYFMEAR